MLWWAPLLGGSCWAICSAAVEASDKAIQDGWCCLRSTCSKHPHLLVHTAHKNARLILPDLQILALWSQQVLRGCQDWLAGVSVEDIKLWAQRFPGMD